MNLSDIINGIFYFHCVLHPVTMGRINGVINVINDFEGMVHL